LTKHELLTVFSGGPQSISDLMKIDAVSRPALWKTIEKLRKEGCLRVVAIRGRARIYEITDRGLSKLDYYDGDGCVNPLCPCHR
jgi:biotin operon repressor